MGPAVSVEWHGRVMVATLAVPTAGNALSVAMVEALHGVVDAAEEGRVALLCLRSQGNRFCTGFDLTAVEDETDASLLARFVRIEMLLARVHSAPFATLAFASGTATGAGADLYAACSRRYCGPDAKFSFPGAGFGLVLGTGRLAALVGASSAQELVASGRTIDAQESMRLGLSNAMIACDDFEAVLESETQAATRLDRDTLASVRSLLADRDADRDLAALVRSAARAGLKDRIVAHLARVKAGRASAVAMGNAYE